MSGISWYSYRWCQSRGFKMKSTGLSYDFFLFLRNCSSLKKYFRIFKIPLYFLFHNLFWFSINSYGTLHHILSGLIFFAIHLLFISSNSKTLNILERRTDSSLRVGALLGIDFKELNRSSSKRKKEIFLLRGRKIPIIHLYRYSEKCTVPRISRDCCPLAISHAPGTSARVYIYCNYTRSKFCCPFKPSYTASHYPVRRNWDLADVWRRFRSEGWQTKNDKALFTRLMIAKSILSTPYTRKRLRIRVSRSSHGRLMGYHPGIH